MSELTFISSVMFLVPVIYIGHKFYHLNKSIHKYTSQVKSFHEFPITEPETPSLQPNLTLIRCQRCVESIPEEDLPKVAVHR